MIKKININDKFTKFDEIFSPKIISEFDDYYIKITRLLGELPRHKHSNSSEIFIIFEGNMEIHFDDGIIELEKGDMINIPPNTYHKPIAKSLCKVILIEKKDTINTGDQVNKYTLEKLDWI